MNMIVIPFLKELCESVGAQGGVASKGNLIMRKDVFFTDGGEDRRHMEEIFKDPGAKQKHLWHARIYTRECERMRHGRDCERTRL